MTSSGFPLTLPIDPIQGIYFHIPFCRTRCSYCDFYSTCVSDFDTQDVVSQYTTSLTQDLLRFEQAGIDLSSIQTAYFGGGTPSIVPIKIWERFIGTMRDILPLMDRFFKFSDREITVECNPESITQKKLVLWKDLGITRISMGIQSFNNVYLNRLNRIHTLKEVDTALNWISQMDGLDCSVDLIYGLPGQTCSEWEEDLKRFLSFNIPHISCYGLELHSESQLAKQLNEGSIPPLPSDEAYAQMYLYTIHLLKDHGYCHYEVSNFAKPGYSCRHNEFYWTGAPYLGMGASAAGYLGLERYAMIGDIKRYLVAVEHDLWDHIQVEQLNMEQRFLEFLFLRLRRAEGIPYDLFETMWGISFPENDAIIVQLQEEGYLISENKGIHFSEQGFLFANTIILQVEACIRPYLSFAF